MLFRSSYVVFGRAAGFASTINLSTLDGSTGFRLDGVAAYDQSGRSVARAGDVNGDGFDDLIVGAFGADPNGGQSGSSYVVFGRASGFASTINLSTLNGSTGFRLDGVAANDSSGFSVSSAGDVNGDGFDDLIVGARFAGPNGNPSAGSSYVIFGFATAGGNIDVVGDSGDNTITLAGGERGVDGGAGNDQLTGNADDNTLIGGLGNDTLEGAGGNDIMIGGSGDDVLVYDIDDTLRVDGGSGFDTLRLTDGDSLDLTALADGLITGIERIDLETDAAANTVDLALRDLLALSDSTNDLYIIGNNNDVVDLGAEFVDSGTNVSVDGRMFDLYTVAGTDAQLFIEQGLQVV